MASGESIGWAFVIGVSAAALVGQLWATVSAVRGRSMLPGLLLVLAGVTAWLLVAYWGPWWLRAWSVVLWLLTVRDVWDEWRRRRRRRLARGWAGYKAEALRARLLARGRAAGA